ncbi:CopD family protein [Melaminivora sp.]
MRANSSSPGFSMLYNALKLLHLLSIIVWVGGMVFAHFFLRPAAQQLEPPLRVALMHGVLQRFLAAVGIAVVLALTSGLAMIGMVSMGGGFSMPADWNFMSGLGLLMMAIYGYIYLALLSRLDNAVAQADWPAGAQALARIRSWVSMNLLLGMAIIVVVLLW